MSKWDILIIILIILIGGYLILEQFGLLGWVSGFMPQISGATTQITNGLNQIGQFMKEYSWVMPVIGFIGTISAYKITSWSKTKEKEVAVNTVQNQAIQDQSSLLNSYGQLEQKYQQSQEKISQLQTQLANVPNVATYQTQVTQLQDRVRMLEGNVEWYKTELQRLTPSVEIQYK